MSALAKRSRTLLIRAQWKNEPSTKIPRLAQAEKSFLVRRTTICKNAFRNNITQETRINNSRDICFLFASLLFTLVIKLVGSHWVYTFLGIMLVQQSERFCHCGDNMLAIYDQRERHTKWFKLEFERYTLRSSGRFREAWGRINIKGYEYGYPLFLLDFIHGLEPPFWQANKSSH